MDLAGLDDLFEPGASGGLVDPCVEDLPGLAARLRQNVGGELGVADHLVAEALALRGSRVSRR